MQYSKMLNATRMAGGSLLALGMIIFLYGLFVSEYSGALIGIGLGTVIGAVFIFLMGIFFVATDEMLERTFKGKPITPNK